MWVPKENVSEDYKKHVKEASEEIEFEKDSANRLKAMKKALTGIDEDEDEVIPEYGYTNMMDNYDDITLRMCNDDI